MIHEHPDYQFALKHMSAEENDTRHRRIRRALDLSLKHLELPKDVQDQIDPFESSMGELIEEGRLLREERDALMKRH